MNRLIIAILLTGVFAAQAAAGAMDNITSAREALRQATARFGEDHPATAMMLNNLALAMREAGYYNYAEHYAGRSLAILERHFGPNDVSLVPPLNVLAEVAFSQGQYAEAREFATRAVAIGPGAEAHYGTALHNLAAIAKAEGKLQESAQYYREALGAWEKTLPARHPFLRQTRMALEAVQR